MNLCFYNFRQISDSRLKELHVQGKRVDKVLQEPKESVFGKRDAKIEATYIGN